MNFLLLIFPQMTEPDMYRLVREVYSEACIENASDKHPERTDLNEAIKEEEYDFVNFLKRFLAKAENTYYVLEADNQWVSALRLTKLEEFYYMEALETAPEHRRKGYASTLIREVISSLSQNGPVKIRSNVSKQNKASLATHRKCGFIIAEENGINYLYGTQNDHLYGMAYSSGEKTLQRGEGEDKANLIAQVTRMEQLLDEVLSAIETRPDAIKNDTSVQEKIRTLKNYYENGQWHKDYECDERGEFPVNLKRGVLAEDTLYDLFSTLDCMESMVCLSRKELK